MKNAASKPGPRPAHIESRREEPLTSSAAGCRSAGERLRPCACESFTTNSWTPASSAPSMAALHSRVISRQASPYSGEPRVPWLGWTTPATPSISTEMKTFRAEKRVSATSSQVVSPCSG